MRVVERRREGRVESGVDTFLEKVSGEGNPSNNSWQRGSEKRKDWWTWVISGSNVQVSLHALSWTVEPAMSAFISQRK